MEKPDSLYLLIKSMTKAEKRHFKVYASRFESNNEKKDYLRLFDVMDAQKEYKRKTIRNKFKHEPYFSQPSAVKRYLHRQIIKSLRNFYDEQSAETRLNNLLIEIEILYKKQLFEDCFSTIKKARAYAEKYNKMLHLLKITDWEIIATDHVNDLEKLNALKDTIVEKSGGIMNRYAELMKIRQVYLESRIVGQLMGEAKGQEEMAWHEQTGKSPLMNNKASSFQGELLRLIMIGHRAQFKRDFEDMHHTIKNMIDFFDLHPHQIEEQPNIYFSMFIELVNVTLGSDKVDEAGELLQKLKTDCARYSHRVQYKYKLAIIETEIGLLINKGKTKEAIALIPELEKYTKISHLELDPIAGLLLYDSIFLAYFANQDYGKSQMYINKIINSPNREIRMDLQYSARIANLVIQYELKEYRLLSYVLRSTHRYLLKRKKVYKGEILIINFLKKAVNFTSEKHVLLALAEIKQQMLTLTDQPFEKNFFIAFPLMKWLDSKLQKKSMTEIAREKYLHLKRDQKMKSEK